MPTPEEELEAALADFQPAGDEEDGPAAVAAVQEALADMPEPAPAQPAPQPQAAPDIHPLESFARGLGRGATLGNWGEAMGWGAHLATPDDAPQHLTRGIAGQPTGMDSATSATLQARRERDEDRQANPTASMIGEGVGAAAVTAPLAVAGGLAAAGAGTAAVPALVGEGMIVGGMVASGEADVDPRASLGEQMNQRSIAAAQGAAMGGPANAIIPAVGQRMASGLSRGGDALQELGEAAASKADDYFMRAQGASKADVKKLADRPGGVERYAQGLRSQGVGEGRLPTTATMTKQAKAALARANADAAEIEVQLAGVPVDGNDVADMLEARFRRELFDAAGNPRPGTESKIRVVSRAAQKLRNQGQTTWDELDRNRAFWGDGTNFDSGSVAQQTRQDIYGAISDAMQESGDQAIPGLGSAWRQASERQHVALRGVELGNEAAIGAGGRSQSDYLASGVGGLIGMSGGMEGSMAGAAAAGAANRYLVRPRENIATERLLSSVSRRAPGMGQRMTGAGQALARSTEAITPASRAVVRGTAGQAAGPMSISPDDVMAQLEQDPNAFGEMTPVIQAAAERGDQQAINMAMLAMARRD